MNKKAFTLVELITTFTLVVAIVIFLIQIVVSLTKTYNNNDQKTKILNKQALISDTINSTFLENELNGITICGKNCYTFNYKNKEETDTLKIENNILTFKNAAISLENATYGDISLDVIYAPTIQSNVNDAIFTLDIPINSDIDYNFDVKIIYQFNTSNSNIDEYFTSYRNSYIVLKGDKEQTFNTQTEYVEQGYTIYNGEGNEESGNVVIENPLTSVPYKTGTYKIKYSLVDEGGNIISQEIRNVTITPSTYNITNLVTNGSFEDVNQSMSSSLNSGGYYEYISSNGINNSRYVRIYPAGTYNYIYSNTTITMPYNHVYYIQGGYRKNGGGTTGILFHNRTLNITGANYVINEDTDDWEIGSYYGTQSNQTTEEYDMLLYGSRSYVSGMYTDWDNIMLIDLTETFGAGNEPSQEWCDENINWFEGTTTIDY